MTGKIETIGVIGAGQMGSGIAHVSALAGYDVLLFDVAPERIEKGIATINGNRARQVSSGKLTEEARQGALGKIAATPTLQGLAGADLVIEAATEDETVKRKIFSQICPILNPEAILATNTSSISITRRRRRPIVRALHRHSLHEPGAGDEASRAGGAHRHRGFDLRSAKAYVRKLEQRPSPSPRISRLHRQPHPAR